jgi:hypothetical protein
MADDKIFRPYRGSDLHRRADEPLLPGSSPGDPLAELARLIGQSDPFAELGRSNSRPAQAGTRATPAIALDDWRHDADSGHHPTDGSRASHREEFAPDLDYTHSVGRQPSRDYDYPDEVTRLGSDQPSYPLGRQRAQGLPHTLDTQFGQDQRLPQERRYEDDRPYSPGQPYQDGQRLASVPPEPEVDYQDEGDVPLAPHEDETYDDAPRARNRGGLVIALVLVGCAMLGIAGAYALRGYTSPSTATPSPPIITADRTTPNKIVPAVAADSPSGKSIQDRVANAGVEQLVSKQEEPVALRELGTQAAPRVVLPAPVAPVLGGSPTLPSAAANSTEPKRIRTVTIRPDGSDASGRPVGALPPPAPRVMAPPPAPKGTAPSARSGTGPVSLEPNEPVAARPRTAALPPASEPVPETPSNASDAHVVQLSSQRSESEAQAAFRSLQAKFPNELGGRQPIIRRADLAGKGVFYRTMVGPFTSSREASQFCASYKAAGGQCVVPTN